MGELVKSLAPEGEGVGRRREASPWRARPRAGGKPRIESESHVAIRRSLENQRDIVRVANDKFGFFEGTQVLDLNRLQDDRNRGAHPAHQGINQPHASRCAGVVQW